VVRDLVEALNARDLARYFLLVHPDFAIRIHADDSGEVEVVAGRRALRSFFGALFEQWTELSYEFAFGPEIVGDCVVSYDKWTGERVGGDGSRQTIARYWAVGTFRGRRCAGMDSFSDRDTALAFVRSLPGDEAGAAG
jgi:hypothetical protein